MPRNDDLAGHRTGQMGRFAEPLTSDDATYPWPVEGRSIDTERSSFLKQHVSIR
jgi:hypothetical protein